MAAIAYPTTDDHGPVAPPVHVVRPFPRPHPRPRPRPRSWPRVRPDGGPRPFPVRPRQPHLSGRSRRVVYRRRRLAVSAAALVVAFSILTATRLTFGGVGRAPLSSSGATRIELRPAAATAYVVRPGDTLWSIARS